MSVSIQVEHVPKQGYWSIGTLMSEVIEFRACFFDEKTIKRGRLFYDSGFYENGIWVTKSDKFLNWAERIFQVSKRFLTRHPKLNAYVGEGAERWRQAGGVFVEFAASGKPPMIAPV